MKLKGIPNQVVQVRRMQYGGRMTIVPIFTFDDNGNAEVDESKLSHTDIAKLKALYGGAESAELTEEELRSMAKERKIKSWHVKSIETLKEEMGV